MRNFRYSAKGGIPLSEETKGQNEELSNEELFAENMRKSTVKRKKHVKRFVAKIIFSVII